MAERFEDMVGFNDAATVQHKADMAYEVACPRGCPTAEPFGSPTRYCDLCEGTGRATLGQIVAADRARREEASGRSETPVNTTSSLVPPQ